MTLIFSQADWHELCQQAPKPQHDLMLDDFEMVTGVPESLGRGYDRAMELLPGVWLSFSDCQYCQDWMFKETVHDHPIQIMIFLSGFHYFDEVYPNLGGTHSYFSGSGISPAYVKKHRCGERVTLVNIEIEPELLESFFLNDRQRQSESMKQLFKGEDWKVSFYPTATAKMRSLAQQIWNAPYQGGQRRMYLQGKVFELLAMQLDLVEGGQQQPVHSPKPTTIDCIHHARDLVLADLEHPPSLLELAQQVGVSVCTLQRRFQELFGMTVFSYLTDQRMDLAEQLLRQGGCTVAEVATIVGYSNLGHFAAAFKRKFGITPRDCLVGRKHLLG
jgi:AraC-like DNA-binding protein